MRGVASRWSLLAACLAMISKMARVTADTRHIAPSDSGVVWSTLRHTDIPGKPAFRVYSEVPDVSSCRMLCLRWRASGQTCRAAVYRQDQRTCHLKATAPWHVTELHTDAEGDLHYYCTPEQQGQEASVSWISVSGHRVWGYDSLSAHNLNAEECRALCLRAPHCASVEHNATSGDCYLQQVSWMAASFPTAAWRPEPDVSHHFICREPYDTVTNGSYDVWTNSPTGCPCYYDPADTSCACCEEGGCQCDRSNSHQCVRCGEGQDCGARDVWTRSLTGCPCYFNTTDTSCACCEQGGCQCDSTNRHQCVECGRGKDCGIRDMWTRAESGCPCYYNRTDTSCACCEQGGCQCHSSNKHQCVRCDRVEDCDVPGMWTVSASGCPCYYNSSDTSCACCLEGGCQCHSSNKHECVRCDHGEDCDSQDQWTRSPSGCACYFNRTDTSCACCRDGGCQCGSSNKHQCVRCGRGQDCDTPDVWTRSQAGCPCYYDRSDTSCACCEQGGCQCGSSSKHQCVRCGHGEDCVTAENFV